MILMSQSALNLTANFGIVDTERFEKGENQTIVERNTNLLLVMTWRFFLLKNSLVLGGENCRHDQGTRFQHLIALC